MKDAKLIFQEIEDIVAAGDSTRIEAIEEVMIRNKLEVETMAALIRANPRQKTKLQANASDLNLVEPPPSKIPKSMIS